MWSAKAELSHFLGGSASFRSRVVEYVANPAEGELPLPGGDRMPKLRFGEEGRSFAFALHIPHHNPAAIFPSLRLALDGPTPRMSLLM